MGKEKFIYNIHTLTYEKVVIPFKTRFVQAFGFFSGALVMSVILLGLFYKYFPSPREKELLREIEQMEYKYSNIEGQFDKMSKSLTNIQERDALVHRAVFGMNPINEAIWTGGVGGHEMDGNKNVFPNSWETVNETENRVDLLTRQLTLQAKSLDTLVLLAKEKEKMLASIPSIKPVRQDQVQKSMNELSGFGWRIHPIYKIAKMHEGVDFPARVGTPIQTSGDGVVVSAGIHSGYGNCVEIDHGFGYVTRYAHMSKMSVRVGQKVKKGQQIGAVGDTGLSTAPHLHYEVHYKGRPINPINFCYDGLTTSEYKSLCGSAIRSNQSLD
jgi:Peptidase family M23